MQGDKAGESLKTSFCYPSPRLCIEEEHDSIK